MADHIDGCDMWHHQGGDYDRDCPACMDLAADDEALQRRKIPRGGIEFPDKGFDHDTFIGAFQMLDRSDMATAQLNLPDSPRRWETVTTTSMSNEMHLHDHTAGEPCTDRCTHYPSVELTHVLLADPVCEVARRFCAINGGGPCVGGYVDPNGVQRCHR